MAKKQDSDFSGKSPVRTELADKTKKLGKLTVNIRRPISEEKGDLVETHEVMDQGQVVARYVKKDGEVLETAATADAQSAGIHEKAAKQAGVDKDDVVFTTPGMNAAEAEVESVGDEDGDKPTSPTGEKAELSGKTKEKKPKSKPSEGKKPDASMSKMAKEKTGEADKPGDRDLSKDLEKADKIVDMAERRRRAEEVMKKRTGKSGIMSLLQVLRQARSGSRPDYDPAAAADLSDQIRTAVADRQDASKLDKSEEPWHDPEQHDRDQEFEALLEEKLKRHFGGHAPSQLKKADDPTEAMRRGRVEHGVQRGLVGHVPAPVKPQGNRALPKAPQYRLLTAMESNAKTAKNENVEGDEGQGHLSAILHLAPATLAGVGNVCTGATEGCKDACLNTAGRGGMFKTGEDTNAIQKARIRKTRMLAQNPGKFMDDLVHDIYQVSRHAAASGKKAVVRLNGTSDIAWEDLKLPHFGGKSLFEAFPDIQFYDYTKRPDRVMKNKHANYHLTFSRSDRNENVAQRLLRAGHNVAAVFGGKKLPSQWNGHPVISGDEHDLRFLDPRGGYVVGLKAKGEAQGDRSGFVIWGHEGDPTAVPKEQRGKLAGLKRVEKSENLSKAKQEQHLSPKGKRYVRETRRIDVAVNPDPLATKKPGSNVAPVLKKSYPVGRTKSGKPLFMYYHDNFDKLTHDFTPQEHMEAVHFHERRPGKWDLSRAFDHYRAARRKAGMPVSGLSGCKENGIVKPKDHEKFMEAIGMNGAEGLKKDNQPHPPKSPEDSAHDVAEEGSSLGGELRQLGASKKMSQMLSHLRGLKDGGRRSKENQDKGKESTERLMKPNPADQVMGGTGFGPGPIDNALSAAGGAIKGLFGGGNPMADSINAAGAKAMGKALPAPAAPSKPIAPPPPVIQQKPKKPGTTTYSAPKSPEFAMTKAASWGDSRADSLEKGAKWPVPGKVPPKMPERPATSLSKSEKEESENTAGNRKRAKEDYESDMKEKAKEPPAEKSAPKGADGAKPYNVYAACASSLKKATESMRTKASSSEHQPHPGPSVPDWAKRVYATPEKKTEEKSPAKQGEKLKKDVFDIKTGKKVAATELGPHKPLSDADYYRREVARGEQANSSVTPPPPRGFGEGTPAAWPVRDRKEKLKKDVVDLKSGKKIIATKKRKNQQRDLDPISFDEDSASINDRADIAKRRADYVRRAGYNYNSQLSPETNKELNQRAKRMAHGHTTPADYQAKERQDVRHKAQADRGVRKWGHKAPSKIEPAPGASFAEKKAAPADKAPPAHGERNQRIRGSLEHINRLTAALRAASASENKASAGKERKFADPAKQALEDRLRAKATPSTGTRDTTLVQHKVEPPPVSLDQVRKEKVAAPQPATPKPEGYDFEAAKKRYHELKAKQAERIKNQDIQGKIRRGPRF